MLSSGAKKDLLVLNFCQALILVSKTEDVFSDDDIVNRVSNKKYHLNKRIDRALEALSERMGKTIEGIIQKEGYALSKWLKSALNSKVAPTLKSITSKTINLEMLALWIAFVNFAERDKTLIIEFKEYEEANQYFRIIELIGGTDVARLEGELFEEAYKVVAILAFNGLGLLGCEYEGSFCITGSCISAILDSLGSVLKTKVGWRLSTELNYIIKICDYEINELGYDFKKMMLEKIKVLHSRIQSPTQARDWAENGASGKWEKSTFPEHIAMVYKPDFESCRLKK